MKVEFLNLKYFILKQIFFSLQILNPEVYIYFSILTVAILVQVNISSTRILVLLISLLLSSNPFST